MACIEKRGNSFRIRVKIDGYTYTKTWKPPKDLAPSKAKKELNKAVVLFEEECKKGKVAKGIGNITLQDFIDEYYLPYEKEHIEVTTYDGYVSVINMYIKPMIGFFKLKKISYLHIQKFVDGLCQCEVHNNSKKRKLSPSTIQRHYGILQGIFRYAYKMDFIPYNPCTADRITLPRKEEKEIKILTKEETRHIFELLKNEPLQKQVLFHFAINSGCRMGEIVALKWEDIDFNNNVVKISKSAYRLTGDKDNRYKKTKTRSIRNIVIPSYIIELLRKWKVEQAKLQLSLGDAWKGDNFIFIQADGKNMFYKTPSTMWKKFLKKYNIDYVNFHALRHTSGTLLLSNGVDIKNVGARLGHSQMKTTARYVHYVEAIDRHSADIFDNMFGSDNKKKMVP